MLQSVLVVNENLPGLNPVQFGTEDCAPSHAFGPAVRTFWLLHHVSAGQGTFVREGKTYHLRAGDVFVIPPYLETYYEADAQKPWQYEWIGFTTEFDLPDAFHQPVLHNRELSAVFEEMMQCGQRESGRSAFLCGCLWKLVSVLREDNPGADYIEKALSFMHAEYMHGITVQEIADRLNIDRSYFSSLFRERTGMAPCPYLLRLRLEKAAELMTAYGESPATAAASVGYTDICQFSRIFKRHFSFSPRDYKKRFEGGQPPAAYCP